MGETQPISEKELSYNAALAATGIMTFNVLGLLNTIVDEKLWSMEQSQKA